MTRTVLIWMTLTASPCCLGETLLDQVRMLDREQYDRFNGNAIGGEEVWGRRYALQVSDDFLTTATGYIITEVEVANLKFLEGGFGDARLGFFADFGGFPAEEPVFNARMSELGALVTNREFTDGIWGLVGVITTFSNLSIELEPSTGYFMCLQVYSGGDWAYTIRSSYFSHNGADSYLRDGPADEGEGGYGWTMWRSAGDAGYGAGDSAYRIEAVPEPGTLALLTVAALALRRSR